MAKKATASRKRVSVDELKKFVEVFQGASSIEEVAKATSWKIEKVRAQATRLRKRGVPLRKFPKQTNLSPADIASFKELCEGENLCK